MIPLPNTSNNIDEAVLHKYSSSLKIKKLLDFLEKNDINKITKYASSSIDTEQLVKLFMHMLSCLNIKTGQEDINNVISGLSKSAKKEKTGDRKEDIKIVSKNTRDSHYQVDISKDTITKNNKRVFMVSCYARDAYLGRYLIKRNYFFGTDREAAADAAYDEITNKMNAIKDRYYNEIIDVPTVSHQFITVLDGVVSELKIDDN